MSNQLNLQYANQSLIYTTQFIASMSDEEVVLDCGSVVVANGDNDQKQLPIHTRLALPWSAVQRLHGLLGELIQSRGGGMDVNVGNEARKASLPPLSMGDLPAAADSRTQ